MAIVNTVSLNEFRDAFHEMDRGDQFSYKGLEALFNELEEYNESTDTPFELDVIALCCDYTEVEDADDFLANYGETSDFAQKWKDIKRELAEDNWVMGEDDEDFSDLDESEWDFD